MLLPSLALATLKTSVARGRGDIFTTHRRAALSSPVLSTRQRGCGCAKRRHGRLYPIATLSGLCGGCGFLMATLPEYGSARLRSVRSERFLRMAGEFMTVPDGMQRAVSFY